MSEFTKQYTDLLTIQYHNKIKALGTIEAFAKEYEKLFNLYESFESKFSLDDAIGNQLDILGKIVGVNRYVQSGIPKYRFGFAGTLFARPFGAGSFADGTEPNYSASILDDDTLRLFAKAKVIKNFIKAKMITIETPINLQVAMDFIFENKGYIIDNRNMTYDLYISNTIELERVQLINSLGLIPLPCGCGINQIIQY